MVCIYCGGSTEVTNSRRMKRHNGVWRRRACKQCGSLVTTVEQIELATALLIASPSGRLKPFSRDKLYISLYGSLGHRKSAQEDAAHLCDTVIVRLIGQISDATCQRRDLSEIVASTLDRFDKAAATHYRAYHP